jgi:hypothetical protein
MVFFRGKALFDHHHFSEGRIHFRFGERGFSAIALQGLALDASSGVTSWNLP